jgi:phosphoserine phosphatase
MFNTDSNLAQEIIKQIQNQTSEPFAIFDFDNSCIFNDIAEATLTYLCRNKLLKDFTLLGEDTDRNTYHERFIQTYYALYRDKKIKEAYKLNSQMFSGFTPEEAVVATHAAIQAEGSELGEAELYGVKIAKGLAARPDTIALMDFLKSKNVKIWMVSASPEIAVKTAMEHFGIVTDHLIGVKGILKDGMYTSDFEMPMSVIEGKVECLRKFIDPIRSPFVAVDDSTTGLPILGTASIKVVVNRGNALTEVARTEGEENKWFLI